jgi:hypothetical protein
MAQQRAIPFFVKAYDGRQCVVDHHRGTLHSGEMMLDGANRFYDKAKRDRQHAVRRIQFRRARSIASWAMLPWLIIAAAGMLIFYCIPDCSNFCAERPVVIRVNGALFC